MAFEFARRVWRGVSFSARFWSNVRVGSPDACWPWLRSVSHRGYGYTKYFGAPTMNAHRIAWFLSNGDPGEMHVLHQCDNRVCCNHAHLFLGTNDENVADKVSKGRQAQGPELTKRIAAGWVASGFRSGV